ncbi:MAG: hypothetical protein Q9215_005706 [Flavoplaca cf. flavocitrina]
MPTIADRGPVSLPLQKLSFCTTPLLHSKLVWEHLSDQTRICAVFDQVKKPGLGQTATLKHVLKLVQDGRLLEEIDLDSLTIQVRHDDEKYQSQQIQDADRYVVLIVKCPAAALRYQLSTGENLPSDFGTIPIFDTTFNASASSSPHTLPGITNSIRSPTHPLPGQLNLLPGPAFEERAATSYVHPSSITRQESPERPATAPLTLTQLMPPKRELPFSKATTRPSEVEVAEGPQTANKRPVSRAKTKQTKQPSRPSSRAKATPAASKARPLSASSKLGNPTDESMIVRLKTGPGSSIKNTDVLSTLPSMATNPKANDSIMNPVVANVSPNKPDTSTSNTASPRRTDLVATLSDNTTENILRDNLKSVHPQEDTENLAPNNAQKGHLKSPLANEEDITAEEYMFRLDHWVRSYQNLPGPAPVPACRSKTAIPASTDPNDLAAFAAQPEAERLAALDEMICECLDDPNFATLCEDVEKSWKRIGLGF